RIPVVQGYFNVMLGPVDTTNRPLTGAFLGATRFLEIKVGTNNPISPRQQILSAPYALNSANAANVLAGGVSTLALPQGAVTGCEARGWRGDRWEARGWRGRHRKPLEQRGDYREACGRRRHRLEIGSHDWRLDAIEQQRLSHEWQGGNRHYESAGNASPPRY